MSLGRSYTYAVAAAAKRECVSTGRWVASKGYTCRLEEGMRCFKGNMCIMNEKVSGYVAPKGYTCRMEEGMKYFKGNVYYEREGALLQMGAHVVWKRVSCFKGNLCRL